MELLAGLAPHSQVMLAIPNPCRYYWGDIMDGRELLSAGRRRQAPRTVAGQPTLAPDTRALEDLHAHAHPLLAACDNGRLVRMNRVGPRGNFRDWANLLETLVRVTESTGQLTEQVEAVSLHQCGYTLPAELAKWLPR